ncbi:MAG TPA: ATP-binding protein, partial [Isosphaeraceae bacterium]|nr:ATP-binding protein [Isosphaeraceae bacterium]
KFTEAGSVTVTASATSDGGLSLKVRDTGPGIPDDQLERIFDEFAQLRNPERDRTKGTGLGLAICKRLVEAVGGRLLVTSRLGSGSTFNVLYPPDHLNPDARPAPPEREAEPRAQDPGVPRRALILLVEDDARSREALSRLLAHVGYLVQSAADGAEALQALVHARPALILLDLMLPGMDGVEVLRRVRELPEVADVPVVLISGDVLGEHHDELGHLGVAETLAKPVDFDALLAVIARQVHNEPRKDS